MTAASATFISRFLHAFEKARGVWHLNHAQLSTPSPGSVFRELSGGLGVPEGNEGGAEGGSAVARVCATGGCDARGNQERPAPLAQVEIDLMELLKFIMTGWAAMNEMCEQAGMSERAIYDRSKEIMSYYHLPFDVPPPP